MSQTQKPPFPRDDDFYRRKRSRPSSTGERTLTRFFQTAQGPGTTPYPRSGSVFYAELLRDVTFSPVQVGTTGISATGTDHFEFLYNLTGSPPAIGSICLAEKVGARWWIKAVLAGGGNGFPEGVICNPFDCTYPGVGRGQCTGLDPVASGIPDYVVNLGSGGNICGGAAGGSQILRYSSNCEWRTSKIVCGGRNLFWKLTINLGASNNGEQGSVILQLYDFDTGQAYDPPIKYCKFGGYPLWCANCDNGLEICCGIGEAEQTIGSWPNYVCVQPLPVIPTCANCGTNTILDRQYLVSISGISIQSGMDPCIEGFEGSFVVTWCPCAQGNPNTCCLFQSPLIGPCVSTLAGGGAGYDASTPNAHGSAHPCLQAYGQITMFYGPIASNGSTLNEWCVALGLFGCGSPAFSGHYALPPFTPFSCPEIPCTIDNADDGCNFVVQPDVYGPGGDPNVCPAGTLGNCSSGGCVAQYFLPGPQVGVPTPDCCCGTYSLPTGMAGIVSGCPSGTVASTISIPTTIQVSKL